MFPTLNNGATHIPKPRNHRHCPENSTSAIIIVLVFIFIDSLLLPKFRPLLLLRFLKLASIWFPTTNHTTSTPIQYPQGYYMALLKILQQLTLILKMIQPTYLVHKIFLDLTIALSHIPSLGLHVISCPCTYLRSFSTWLTFSKLNSRMNWGITKSLP